MEKQPKKKEKKRKQCQTDEGSTSEIRPVAKAQQFSPEYNDSFLEVVAQVKLLLKIIQDHKQE